MAKHDHMTGCGCGLYRECELGCEHHPDTIRHPGKSPDDYRAENQRLRASLHITAMQAKPHMTHEQIAAEIERVASGEAPNWNDKPDWRAVPLREVHVPPETRMQSFNALCDRFGTVGALADAGEQEVLRTPWMGRKTLNIAVDIVRRAMAGEDVRRDIKLTTIADMARKAAP